MVSQVVIPSDPLAIDLGLRRLRAIEEAQAWNAEAIRIGELVWLYCDAKDWPDLELTFNGITVAREDGTEVEPWEA